MFLFLTHHSIQYKPLIDSGQTWIYSRYVRCIYIAWR